MKKFHSLSHYLDPLIFAPFWKKILVIGIMTGFILYIPFDHMHAQWHNLHQVYQKRTGYQEELAQLYNDYHALKQAFPSALSVPSHTLITEYFLHQKSQIKILQMQWETDMPYLSMNVITNYQNLMHFIQLVQQKFPLLHLNQLNIRKKYNENRGVIDALSVKMIWRLTA